MKLVIVDIINVPLEVINCIFRSKVCNGSYGDMTMTSCIDNPYVSCTMPVVMYAYMQLLTTFEVESNPHFRDFRDEETKKG
jgi:hypothetical protein